MKKNLKNLAHGNIFTFETTPCWTRRRLTDGTDEEDEE